ncbi:MAG TPA: flagellar export chaperone FlgN [Phycisphaerae bacterium]|nr:flagellar export chaperone FlgN [Phycisphaerae bacterium]
MISPSAKPTDPTDELARLLEAESALLDLRRSQLASLCGAIIDRDDEAVERLLDQVERAQELQSATDRELDVLRRQWAERLGCPPEEVKLSRLIAALPEPLRGALAEQRQQIIERAEGLQREHMRTVMVLTECARINRLLLESLFPESQGVTTYSAAGSDPWRPEAGLVDAER